MLSVEGLNQFYAESHILWDIELNIPEGECRCIMGRNGVGKTTLLKAIIGLLPVRSGTIVFGEQSVARRPAAFRAHAGIGYVPQGREIFPQLTVEENLRVGLLARPDRQREIPREIYDLFPALKKMLRRRGGDLSGGQQQQLAIGRALEWLPLETIIYNQAKVKTHTIVTLQPGAEFIGWEMISLGLPASRQPLRSGSLDQRLTVRQDNHPLLLESLRIEDEDEILEANWGLAGRPVTGTLIAATAEDEVLEAIRQSATDVEPGNYFGATRINGLTVCRFLGQDVGAGFTAFRKVWEVMRPAVLNRDVCLPRIWAT